MFKNVPNQNNPNQKSEKLAQSGHPVSIRNSA
jgi:hypothetical protein